MTMTKTAPEVFHASTYTGRKPVLTSDDDKPHRCPQCWSVLYSSAGLEAVVLPLDEVRECWHCGAYVAPFTGRTSASAVRREHAHGSERRQGPRTGRMRR